MLQEIYCGVDASLTIIPKKIQRKQVSHPSPTPDQQLHETDRTVLFSEKEFYNFRTKQNQSPKQHHKVHHLNRATRVVPLVG